MLETLDVTSLSEYVDIADGLKRIRDNKTLYAKMLQMFLKSDQFEKIDECLQKGDLKKAADAAHAIKGMTGNLSMTKLFHLSTQLMETLRQDQADEECIRQYREALQKTIDYVEYILNDMG